MPSPALVHALTVDVEDYFHVSGFADRISSRDWGSYPSRVVANTHRVLDLLNRHQSRGTFFILGWVADRYPRLVRDIQKAGHEIGCHSYWHRLIYDLTPDQFQQDLSQARVLLEDLTGEAVRLFRAPSFSITRRSLWAFEVLAAEGFTIDSSIYPVLHDRYGIPQADPAPHHVRTESGRITEFPGTVFPIHRLRLAVSGGGYFRLYPVRFTAGCLNLTARRTGLPVMFYIHPWELDPDQPRLPGSFSSRFRHYLNLHRTEARMNWLLPRLRFGSMSESLESIARTLSEYSLSEGLYGGLPVPHEIPSTQQA